MTRHFLIRDQKLRGIFYGFHRDFEDEILRVTQGEIINLPENNFTKFRRKYAAHGTNKENLRPFIPKTCVNLERADVVWWILNNPNNYQGDLYNFKFKKGAKRILYITDTFYNHFSLIKKLNFDNWDYLFTSIHDAVDHLKALTNRDWHYVPQGVNLKRFSGAKLNKRVFNIASFGRRSDKIHKMLKSYSKNRELYYHYNVWKDIADDIDEQEFYEKYAWDLGHAGFTISYPRELTHPEQLGEMSLISVRYFEAAASCTPIIGVLPSSKSFEDDIGRVHCLRLPLDSEAGRVGEVLDSAFSNLEEHHNIAKEIYGDYSESWTWMKRVKSILSVLE